MKKFLSLALALVMTMSLVVVGAGAKEFTDDSKIAYDDAVAVISACKIIDGYTDGSFNPAGTLTRGAAAKIICNMILGPTTAAALSADTAPFKDVPANHVFAGYIAYCAQQGIINGYADGTFKPAGTVTGYQFMKMLLGALGYEGKYEGFTGANWSVNVAKLALNLGLDDGNDEFVGTKAMTREEACLYAFNTLKADMVEYDSNTQITIGDVVISTASKAKKVENDAKVETIENDDIMQFAEKYFSKLETETDSDDFGRPATKWTYDDKTVGTYADEADYTLVLDKKYTQNDDVLKVLKDLTDNDDLKLYTVGDVDDVKLFINGDDFSGKDFVSHADKGTIVELFCDDDYIKTVVAVDPTLVEIKDVTTKVSATAEKKGAEYAIKLDGLTTYYDAYDKDDSKVLPGFDPDTYTKGTQIVIVKGTKGILDSYVAETVKGQISSYKADTYVTIDGTKYTCAGGVTTGTLAFDKEYTLYLDSNGYILKVGGETATAISDVYYVTGVYADITSKGVTTYYAETVSLEGVVEDVVLSKKDALAENAEMGKFTQVGDLYVLTKNSDDEYESEAFDSSNKDYDVHEGTLQADAKKDASKIYVSSSDRVYLDDTTAFLSVKLKDTDVVKSVSLATGGMSMVKNVKTFAITKDGKTDALYVLYVGASVSAAVDTGDVVFVTEKSDTQDSKDTYLTQMYFMEDNSTDEDGYTVKGQNDVGFYTYAINDDGEYELTKLDRKDAKVDEDYSGWTTILFKDAGIHNDTVSFTAGSRVLEDVDFSNATVIDLRDADDVDNGVYKYDRTITSVSDLKDAAAECDVHAYIYVTDGDITFVAVSTDTTNTTNKK